MIKRLLCLFKGHIPAKEILVIYWNPKRPYLGHDECKRIVCARCKKVLPWKKYYYLWAVESGK